MFRYTGRPRVGPRISLDDIFCTTTSAPPHRIAADRQWMPIDVVGISNHIGDLGFDFSR
jgi:hypothetical protein